MRNIKDILQNPARRKIFNYIKENPGVYYYRIIKDLNISSHVVLWHLDVLETSNFICKGEIENHEVYFSTNLKFQLVRRFYFLNNKKCNKIIEYLKKKKKRHIKNSLVKNA